MVKKILKILLLIYSFFVPFLIKKKDYNLIILRFDSNKFMFNTKVFFEFLLKHSNYNVKYIINDIDLKKQLEKKYCDHFIEQKTFKDIWNIARAGTWLTDGGFPLKTPFGHKDRVLINLEHGMYIKYAGLKAYKGLSELRVSLQLKMFAKHYNAFCVTSKMFIPIVEEAYLVKTKNIKILGQARNDLLFANNDRDGILKNLYDNLPKYHHIILYAPTYRTSQYGNASGKLQPTKYFPFNDFNQNKLEEFLEKHKIIVFIRSHHLEQVKIKESNRVRFLNADKVSEISDILNIFELLISDYSSIIYDFLLTGNPMLFLPYDLETFKKYAGLYFDYDFISPGPKPKSQTEFQNELLKLLTDKTYFEQDRKSLRKKVFEVEKDNCQRIYNFMINEIQKYQGKQ